MAHLMKTLLDPCDRPLVTQRGPWPFCTRWSLPLFFMSALLCLCAVISVHASVKKGAESASTFAGVVIEPPPLYRINASSYYDAGLKHGRIAQDRIMGWLLTAEMQSAVAWVSGDGRMAFDQMKKDNSDEFPDYAEELRGIAEGANVSLDGIWVSNLLVELENLMHMDGRIKTKEHCSDIYAVAPDGFDKGFAHGHNEDWDMTVKKYWYFLAFDHDGSEASDKLDFAGCAGVTYPGTLVGWVPTWNRHSMWLSANVLVPRHQRRGGLASSFIQRRAFCPARSLDEAIVGLTRKGWTGSVSMNVVDLRGKRMANIEVWEDIHSVLEVTSTMGNYSHFNEFKHLKMPDGTPIDDPARFKTDKRQGRVDMLAPPRSALDVMERLSDPDVFRPNATIVTVVVNGTTGTLNVWCAKPSFSSSPVYSWNLFNFFDKPGITEPQLELI
eukprot:TRINITY_DN45332_c0_g1_i1.p1 TRINITY_DN45332_c0_g1~~TRINITY_DN45332_c0_g1_i1.p1  ORF type:complete len:441 (+),score=38.31 TRINITY_DN45332_c0_g1_i1:87-1409(+)